MISDAKRLQIEMRANEVLKRANVTNLPVDPIVIAESRGISVVAKESSDKGVSGMLLQHNGSFGIVYATHIQSEGFRRFSIAHELGHYFLDGHPEKLFENADKHISRAGFASGNDLELEADHFAAALLMPKATFVRAMDRRKDGLDAIEGLSKTCQTSLVATAIRYAETTSAPRAIVVSNGRYVEYAFLSKSLKSIKGLSWPKRGSLVPKTSITGELNANAAAIAACEKYQDNSDLSIWFGGRQNIGASEEAIGLGSFGRTLTVITASFDEDEDENEDDDNDRSHGSRDRW